MTNCEFTAWFSSWIIVEYLVVKCFHQLPAVVQGM